MSDLLAALGGAALPRPQRAGAVRMRSDGEALGDGADDLLVVLRAVVESQLALGPLPPAADGRARASLAARGGRGRAHVRGVSSAPPPPSARGRAASASSRSAACSSR